MHQGTWTGFRCYGQGLLSNLHLPELPNGSDLKPQLCFTILPAQEQEAPANWFHEWRPEGYPQEAPPWLQIATCSDGYLLRFPGLADFRLSSNGHRIDCRPTLQASDGSIRHLLLDQVLPLTLSLDGHIILHAAGVVLPGGEAIAFAAATGAGKSTLTAALLNSRCQLLTDDGLLLRQDSDRVIAIPSYPGVRLWRDSADSLFGHNAATEEYAHYSRKRRISIEPETIAPDAGGQPLKAIYFLGPRNAGSETRFTPLSPRTAFLELAKFTFTIDVRASERLRANFMQFEKLAAMPIHFQLDYPRRWEDLPAVVSAIQEHASQL